VFGVSSKIAASHCVTSKSCLQGQHTSYASDWRWNWWLAPQFKVCPFVHYLNYSERPIQTIDSLLCDVLKWIEKRIYNFQHIHLKQRVACESAGCRVSVLVFVGGHP